MHYFATRKVVTENKILYAEWQRLLKEGLSDYAVMRSIFVRYIEANSFYWQIYSDVLKLYLPPEHDDFSKEIYDMIKRMGWRMFRQSFIKAITIMTKELNVFDITFMSKLEDLPKNAKF